MREYILTIFTWFDRFDPLKLKKINFNELMMAVKRGHGLTSSLRIGVGGGIF